MNRASELGAVFNAETQEERVNYYLTLPSANLEPALQLMNSALRKPLFLEEELLSEKHVVLGEYDRAEASPFWHLDQAMLRGLYPGHFGRKNTIGDRDVIARVTPREMREIQQLYYHPNNTALIIAGDVTPARAFALAERIFGSWPRGPDPFAARPVPAVPPLRGDTGVVVERGVNGLTVMLQWQGPSVGKDEAATFAADVFSDYLNREGSRFQRRLVDSGLWQGVLVNYYTLDQVGPITISGQTTPERFREAMAALLSELDATRDPAYFTADELQEVKAQRAVETAFGMERTSGFAHTVGFWWSVHSLDYLLRYVDAMAAQTPRDLVRYATTYIHDRPRIVGVLLSPADRARLRLTASDLARLGRRAAQ
jgi:zinc protease